MTTPSLRVYPLLYLPHLCHIKTIYGPYMGHPHSQNWTLDFEPAFSPRFSPTLSPRSIFQTSQRFLLLNHVTSGSMSPRSFFPTGQRFPILKHVTSGSHEPAILFSIWSAVSPTGNDMTSSSGHVIALDQSGARKSAKRAQFTTSWSELSSRSALHTATQILGKYPSGISHKKK